MRLLRKAAVSLVMVGAVGLSAACSDQGAASAPASTAAAIPAGTHVHAAVRDPADGTLLVATHTGLFKKSDDGLTSIGPVVDLMGFAVASDGTYYASGHPGMQTDLPQPLGLVRSTDGGATWEVVSRGGESDFHALAVSGTQVVGFDGALRQSPDGKEWTTLAIPLEPISLAFSPDGSTVLASTGTTVLRSGTDLDTWTPMSAAPAAVLVAYADADTIIVLAQDGRLHQSTDAGATWTAGTAAIAGASSLSASRVDDTTVEVLLGSGNGVLSTTDLGASTTALV
ncbi:F510_1955 family glycosylhydrolase [Blastococcus sp. Marseille-P5729]|uniref:F510_1955 family glycosylhydrolase n=1 Tax=Blastococcus sp. Marseille-P5729 TaxID=2086582 RepID=UPI0018FE12F4|nr:exo-alpha-sialidase [Blastococcus sp. Marseille-P5729]